MSGPDGRPEYGSGEIRENRRKDRFHDKTEKTGTKPEYKGETRYGRKNPAAER